MKSSSEKNRLNILRRIARLVFPADSDRDEGGLAPEKTDRAGRANTAAGHHRHNSLKSSGEWTYIRLVELQDIYEIFCHNSNKGWCFLAERQKSWMEGRAQVDVPWMLERQLNKVELHSPFNELNRKTRLDFLIHHVFDQLNGPVFSNSLSLKTDLKFAYHGFARSLGSFYGIPYYSLWYGPVRELATNFVVVHTETPGFFDEAVVHAFMSWVCMARVHLGKRNCTVYGLATDSHDFWFYRINDRGKWSHTVLKPVDDWHYKDIAALIGFIFHEAYLAAQETQETPNPRNNTTSKLQVTPLSDPDTNEFSFENLPTLPPLPEGWETLIN